MAAATDPAALNPTNRRRRTAAAPTLPKVPFGQYSPQAGFNRDAQLAANAYGRTLAQQRGARRMAEIDRQGARNVEGLATSYAQRGLANSGIYGQAQNQYAQDWTNQRQSALDDLYDQLRQLSVSDMGTWQQFNNDVIDTAAQKQNDILQMAAQLSQLRGYAGR